MMAETDNPKLPPAKRDDRRIDEERGAISKEKGDRNEGMHGGWAREGPDAIGRGAVEVGGETMYLFSVCGLTCIALYKS